MISWLKRKRGKGKDGNPILVKGQHKELINDELWSLV